jgi:ABC-type Fe3+/spermidine/putrescine transport system ATPase subunit
VTLAIELEHVSFTAGSRRVLDDVSLALAQGELLALLGPSGSGKTTLLRVILGFVAPESGVVRIEGVAVSAYGRILRPPEERGLAMIFQDLALWPHLTVAGNLEFGLASRGVPRADRLERISTMLSRVGLADRARAHPAELSGGERQRVAIARALVLEPKALLLDEPLSNLDALLKRDLTMLLAQLVKERSAPTLYVTHDIREAAALGRRIAVLESGRITQEGSMDTLRTAPASPFVRTMLEDFRAG